MIYNLERREYQTRWGPSRTGGLCEHKHWGRWGRDTGLGGVRAESCAEVEAESLGTKSCVKVELSVRVE